MTADAILAALALPSQAVNRVKVPKKTLAENAANSAADRKLITEGVEEIVWVASLKPTTVGVPAFRDEAREYLEVAVLAAEWKPGGKGHRLRELIHRAIPYPTLLVSADGSLSAAHIRRSGSDAAATVLDGDVHTGTLFDDEPASVAFLASLPLAGLPNGDLYVLYQAYIDRLTALAVARVTGTFAVVPPAVAERHRSVLDDLAELDADIARTQKNAESASQIAKRVEYNVTLQRLTAARAALLTALSPEPTP
jgi:hypothetical protein